MPAPAPTPDDANDAVTHARDRGDAGAGTLVRACPICAEGVMRVVEPFIGTCVRPARIDTS